MNYRTLTFDKLGETIYEYEHKTGLKVFFVKKAGYNKKTAMFGTNYGSIDSVFKVQGNDKEIHVPDGIAHFLEHKLFEQEDGNMLDKFTALGSNPNAFTSFNQTVYYFSCTDLFEENFRMLLDYVQKPWLTDENVEKEKGIIGQEIRMYEDNADWRVFFNLLDCLYVNHPVKLEIAGTIESISKITKELLYDCYNTFYTPSNMVVVVVGDFEPEKVFSIVDDMIQFKDKGKVEKKYPDEPKEINREYNEQKLAVSMPLFNMGVKDNVQVSGLELLKRRIGLGIALYYTMGRSSDLYNRLYEERLINDSFRFEVSLNSSYGYLAWGGQSPDPKKTAGIISEELKKISTNGIGQEAFKRIKKSQEGMFIRSLNSIDSIAREIMDSYFNGANYFDVSKAYEQVDIEFTNRVMKEVFENQTALSVINPL
ncbi:MAG: EF-P 5-aminopentanol modification-associated protein YfmH [Acetivibrionales bacterium]|jgi:predicted Zn-dependent peptidase